MIYRYRNIYCRLIRVSDSIAYLLPVDVYGNPLIDETFEARHVLLIFLVQPDDQRLMEAVLYLDTGEIQAVGPLLDDTLDELAIVAEDMAELPTVDNILARHDIQLDPDIWTL